MNRIAASRAREEFADTINRVAYTGERIVLHRRGKGVVAIVPMQDVELLEALEDRLDLDAARKALAGGGKNIPFSKIKKSLGL